MAEHNVPKKTNEKNARELIVTHLCAMERGAYLSAIEDSFVRRETYGTAEYLVFLDYLISKVSKIEMKRMEPLVKNALRLALYEIIFEDSVPEYAAVGEAVALVKRLGDKKKAGFVNALLRNILRQKEAFLAEANAIPHIRCACPKWLYELWSREYDARCAEKMCLASLKEHGVTLRVNEQKTAPEDLRKRLFLEGYEATSIPENPHALHVRQAPGLMRTKCFADGLFYVQDLSAQRPVDETPVRAGMRVLDLCAAPGGKSVQAALALGESGSVFAIDKTEEKCARIRENCARLGISNVTAEAHDATVYRADLSEAFDVVLADLPCSGLGVISHKPDLKARVKRQDIGILAALQNRMLDTAARYVKRGGYLTFSTCTVNRTENDANADVFLKTHEDFSLAFQKQDWITEAHDGFFTAIFQRKL